MRKSVVLIFLLIFTNALSLGLTRVHGQSAGENLAQLLSTLFSNPSSIAVFIIEFFLGTGLGYGFQSLELARVNNHLFGNIAECLDSSFNECELGADHTGDDWIRILTWFSDDVAGDSWSYHWRSHSDNSLELSARTFHSSLEKIITLNLQNYY